LYFSAILLSLWNGAAALALCIGLTLLYLIRRKSRNMLKAAGENS
jgi:hypothetical protein